MRAPAIRATIERRILVNYRVEPAALGALLPPPFRPVLVDGLDIAGVCAFLRCAPLGYAATPTAGVFDGVALTTHGWAITPLQLDEVGSSVLDLLGVPDSAFLMAGLGTTWRAQPALVATAGTP